MSAPGRPKGEFRSAQHEGTSVSLIDVLGAVSAEAAWLAKRDDTRFMNDVAMRLQQD